MKRPAWAEMIAASAREGVRFIVVERLDRVSRDLLTQEICIRDLVATGITLLSTCEPDLLSNDPSRILFRQIVGAVSQFDRSMIITGDSGEAERPFRRETERHSGMNPNTTGA